MKSCPDRASHPQEMIIAGLGSATCAGVRRARRWNLNLFGHQEEIVVKQNYPGNRQQRDATEDMRAIGVFRQGPGRK